MKFFTVLFILGTIGSAVLAEDQCANCRDFLSEEISKGNLADLNVDETCIAYEFCDKEDEEVNNENVDEVEQNNEEEVEDSGLFSSDKKKSKGTIICEKVIHSLNVHAKSRKFDAMKTALKDHGCDDANGIIEKARCQLFIKRKTESIIKMTMKLTLPSVVCRALDAVV